MNVTFIMSPVEYYSPLSGGALATCAMQQGRRLIARGYDVSVLTAVRDEAYPVGRVVPIRVKQRDTLSKARRAVSRVRRMITDYEYLYYEYYLSSVLRALRAMRPAPDAVICFNDLRLPIHVKQALPRSRVLLRLSNEVPSNLKTLEPVVRSVDTFLCVSTYIREWLLRTHPVVPQAQAVVLCNGSDPETFSPRADFLEPRTPVRSLFVGRINPDKGPDLAADAVARTQAEGLPVTLTAVGMRWWYGNQNDHHDPYFRTLMEKFKAAGAEHLGHVNRHDIPGVYRGHDVFLLPARWHDPMPQVVFEAMASGCAVIASDRGGIREACGDAAVLLDPDRPGGFADALRRFVAEPDLLREYKRRSIERARLMTWDRNVDTLEQALTAPRAAALSAAAAGPATAAAGLTGR